MKLVELTLKVWILAGVLAFAGIAYAQTPTEETTPWMSVYGFAQLDMGYEDGQSHPDWSDALRTTKLPSYENEYGTDGNFWASVRQTRFGVKAGTPTRLGELKTTFEFELFGTGVDAGQTTFRLRHAYVEIGKLGAGQTWSPFMDADVFPNSVEYWGPAGMVFFRNIQLRWMPIQGDSRLTIALERPGASADQGDYADRIELQNVDGQFKYPDISAEYRFGQPWGYVEVAGIVRFMEWNDMLADQYDLSGSATGWGVNLSSNLKLGAADVLRLQYVYGEGIENYMNDAPADLGIKNNFDNPTRPIEGELLPVTGIVAFLDHTWNSQWTTSIGYSSVDIDNTDGQADNAFSKGQYALANLLYTPVQNLMLGGEVQWGERQNFADGFSVDDLRFQFTVKANFSSMFGGTQ